MISIKRILYKSFQIITVFDQGPPDPRILFDNPSPETIKAWQNGEVYGFQIYKDQEIIDSCYGFYGELNYCIESAKESVDHQIKIQTDKKIRYIKRCIVNRIPLRFRKPI